MLKFILLGLLLVACEKPTTASSSAPAAYSCAMHPSVHRSAPGLCPVCGMELVVSGAEDEGEAQVRLSRTAHMRAEVRVQQPFRENAAPAQVVRVFGKIGEGDVAHLDAGSLPGVAIGADALLMSRRLPGEKLLAKVSALNPMRAQVHDTRLKAGDRIELLIVPKAPIGPVMIPASAVLYLGTQSLVYVEVNDRMPTYEARRVTLGSRRNDAYVLLAGVSEREWVVVNGAFLIDAEAQLRHKVSMMGLADDQPVLAAASLANGTADAGARRALTGIMRAYLDVAQALAQGDDAAAQKGATAVGAASAAYRPAPDSAFGSDWSSRSRAIEAYAAELAESSGVAIKRLVFADLSKDLIALVRKLGNLSDTTLRLVHCPMAQQGKGADWFQRGSEVQNPYYGAAMMQCGTIEEEASAGALLMRYRP